MQKQVLPRVFEGTRAKLSSRTPYLELLAETPLTARRAVDFSRHRQAHGSMLQFAVAEGFPFTCSTNLIDPVQLYQLPAC